MTYLLTGPVILTDVVRSLTQNNFIKPLSGLLPPIGKTILFVFLSFNVDCVFYFCVGRSDGKKRLKKVTRSLRIEDQKPQHQYHRAWKQQDMVTKSIQTQYGGKQDGRCHSKEENNLTQIIYIIYLGNVLVKL